MAYMNDDVYDAGLNEIRNNATTLYICSQEPTTRAEAATTYRLGTKASPVIDAADDKVGGGRECVVGAISDGVVDAAGTNTATHWALVDGTRLLAANALVESQSVTSGNPFTLSAFAFGFEDAVSE